MSLKKRMFRSNMAILFIALFSLMLIILAVLAVFEDSLESRLHAVTVSRLDRHAGEVEQLLQDGEIRNAVELQQIVRKWGYEAAAAQDGRVVSGEDNKRMRRMAEFLEENGDRSGQADLFSFQNTTIAGRYLTDEDIYLMAVHFPDKGEDVSLFGSFFLILCGVVLLVGAGTIAVLMILSALFTRRMNRIVMEPVEKLVAGAERVKEGKLKEDIDYHGEEEFEHVCQAFNAMQHTILANREQRIKNEKARTDMVTGISHDLRTPLTSIQGYIKGVLDGIADTKEKKEVYLKTAYESTEEMNILLQKLFDFSRVESGQLPFHMVQADLAEYTAAYTAQKESVADPSRLKIRLHVQMKSAEDISMDVEQIRRVFDNLLENSMKYAMARPVLIDIYIKKEDGYILLEWKDNGRGVPEEKIGRIFERFYRCDESRKEKGSGVGLYIVKYIMEQHHGTVKAENDGGLKISLYFPGKDMAEAREKQR